MKNLFWKLDRKYVYLDNAASTVPFKRVVSETLKFLETYGSIHRGEGKFSILSTNKYEESRKIVLDFISGKENRDVVIFTLNTSEAINKMAQIFPFQENDAVLISDIEHSANYLPWLKYANVITFKTNENYEITKEAIEEKLIENPNIKIVSIAGASNLTGLITPIKEIYDICKKHNVYLLVDASQMISHRQVSLDDCDFLVFSGHKMYAPYGIGVLAGRYEILKNTGMASTGGGNVIYVSNDDKSIYKRSPYNHEPGTPNGIGAIAIATACIVIKDIGYEKIQEHDNKVVNWMIKYWGEIENVELIFPNKSLVKMGTEHTSIGVINIKNKSNKEVAKILAKNNIGTRSGTFCLYRLIERINKIDNNFSNNIYEKLIDKQIDKLPDRYELIRLSAGLMTTEMDMKKVAKVFENIGYGNLK